MEMRSPRYGAIFVILLCALATVNIECRMKVPQTSLDDGGGRKYHVIDEEMVREIYLCSTYFYVATFLFMVEA